MGISDYFKDVMWALLILIVNFAILFTAIFVLATFIQTGHPPEYYEQAAPGIASWTAPIGGGILFLLVGFFRAKRNLERRAYALVLSMWISYVVFDIALGFLLSQNASFFSAQLVISLSIALLGGIVGARLARSRA